MEYYSSCGHMKSYKRIIRNTSDFVSSPSIRQQESRLASTLSFVADIKLKGFLW